MKIAILHHASIYRGDHTADTCYIIDPMPGETVEQLAARILPQGSGEDPYFDPYSDRIEIKLVRPREEAPDA